VFEDQTVELLPVRTVMTAFTVSPMGKRPEGGLVSVDNNVNANVNAGNGDVNAGNGGDGGAGAGGDGGDGGGGGGGSGGGGGGGGIGNIAVG
jgi:hypothetical protein